VSLDCRARFSANLLRARKQSGMSQEQLAFRAGLHRTEVGLLERRERLARVDTLVKLAGALKVDPCHLLEGIIWEPGQVHTGRFIGC
jgi:transcriptional regulator with XRE-family HTH domain